MRASPVSTEKVTRRTFLASAASAAAVGVTAGAVRSGSEADASAAKADVPPEDYRITRGRIRQSVMAWCYNPLPMERLIEACHRMGMAAMEGISTEYYPQIRKRGMQIAIVGSHGFKKGPLSLENHDFCVEKLREGIDRAVAFGSRNVITFTGMRDKGVTDGQAVRNCVDCWKKVIGYAEKKKVNLCLEHLNSRDDTHPMKGHPGYFGDDVDLCVDLIRRVDSPRMKLLFDIYHVQIMNGDVIRRIRQYKDYIGHIHTAGVPGRGELDETQEINYPPILRAILETGYDGFVAQEFIPTWPDKLAALRHGVRVCDV
jgi:hydroxypyruvate isomerase